MNREAFILYEQEMSVFIDRGGGIVRSLRNMEHLSDMMRRGTAMYSMYAATCALRLNR